MTINTTRAILSATCAVALTCFLPQAAWGYATFCGGGMQANGELSQNVANDGCAVTCDHSNAPKWAGGVVQYHHDITVLPMGITASQWESIIDQVLGEFNSIAGAGLTLSNAGVHAGRVFGGDETKNEIFWLTNTTELREKTGLSEDSFAGLALSRHLCGGALDRPYYDADIVLNGAILNFQWYPDYASVPTSSTWAGSIHAVLTHEIGHTLGLHHPCVDCGTAIMEAAAAHQIENLLPDDLNGLAALYPAPSKGLTTACTLGTDCDSGLCIHDPNGNVDYCSSTCTTDTDCTVAGMACLTDVTNTATLVCRFPVPVSLLPVSVGDNCSIQPCDSTSICSGPDGLATCKAMCDATTPCTAPNTNCVDWYDSGTTLCLPACDPTVTDSCGVDSVCETDAQGVSGCTKRGNVGVGENCPTGLECSRNLLCVTIETTTQASICMDSCSSAAGDLCDDSHYCQILDNGRSSCFPYGSASAGESCVDQSSCAKGTTCFEDSPGQNSCYTKCDQDPTLCSITQNCIEYSDGSANCMDAGIVSAGGECTSALDCAVGLHCYGDTDSSTGASCYASCELSDTHLCSGTARCILVEGSNNIGVCYPYGSLGRGNTCTRVVDCQGGMSCSQAIDNDPSVFTCQKICDPAVPQSCIGRCIQFPATSAACFTNGTGEENSTCASHSDCTPPLLCNRLGRQAVCKQTCSTNADCGSGRQCGSILLCEMDPAVSNETKKVADSGCGCQGSHGGNGPAPLSMLLFGLIWILRRRIKTA